MHSGTLAILEEPVADELESYGSGGFSTLDVRETVEGFDDVPIQAGRAAATVETTIEEIHISGTDIDVEQVGDRERVWTEWVADVTDAGFVAAERTAGNDPEFPFDIFHARTGQPVERVEIDVASVVQSCRDRDRDVGVWMVGTDDGAAELRYHHHAKVADAARANIGVGFELAWNNTVAEGVMYESGYVAVFNDSWGPRKFAAFIRDLVLPHAEVPEDDEEGEQSTLDEDSGDEFTDEVEQHLEDEGLDVETDVEVDS